MFDVSKLISVVESVAEAVVPGADATIKAISAIIALVDNIKPELSSTDQAALEAALPALLAKMNSDVDQAELDLK